MGKKPTKFTRHRDRQRAKALTVARATSMEEPVMPENENYDMSKGQGYKPEPKEGTAVDGEFVGTEGTETHAFDTRSEGADEVVMSDAFSEPTYADKVLDRPITLTEEDEETVAALVHDHGEDWDLTDNASLLRAVDAGMSYEAIAARLGRTKKAVESKVYRLRKKGVHV